jgi:RNA polymerase sigma-70 factor (ECF subfamily)
MWLDTVSLESKDMLTSCVDSHDSQRDGTAGSAWSFRLTVLRHYRPVYRMAAALLGDLDEAQDVTQETFARYWSRTEQISRPRHWLMRVARNGCLDRLRKSGRFVSQDDERTPEPEGGRDPSVEYEREELAAALRRHIDTLPEPQRSLVVLFDMQGFSGSECARILGLNENQVKVYLHRARRRLRTTMEQAHD